MTTPEPPSIFMSDYPAGDPAAHTNAIVPGSSGGLIEAVKRAVVTSVRSALGKSSIANAGQIYVDLEYPTKQEQYPGIWVQFSVTKLTRAGIGQEEWVQDDAGMWSPVRQWTFVGRITLSVVATTSKDRDRLADQILVMLAFSRPSDPGILYRTDANVQQHRQLWDALLENPYVSMTLGSDIITPGGQLADPGPPWQPDTVLYEDSFSVDLLGQFSLRFSHDGVYTLSAVRTSSEMTSVHQLLDTNQSAPRSTLSYGADPNFGYAPSPTVPGQWV